MTDDNQRALAETVFERAQRREREISAALKMEAARKPPSSLTCIA